MSANVSWSTVQQAIQQIAPGRAAQRCVVNLLTKKTVPLDSLQACDELFKANLQDWVHREPRAKNAVAKLMAKNLWKTRENKTSELRISVRRTLPHVFGGFTALESVEINECPLIVALPDNLGRLENLAWLGIKECPKLAALPDSLGQLKQLKRLHITDCPALAALPASLGELTQLEELNIKNCPALRLPKTLARLPTLKIVVEA